MQTPETDTQTLIKALRILANDITSDDGVANAVILEGADRIEKLLELVDGAYDIIELYSPDTENDEHLRHYQKWQNDWLQKACQYGAGSE